MKQIWYVSGETHQTDNYYPTFFDTKLAAERYARMLYPDEGIKQRDARVFSRDVLTMSDLNGG
jgi:hypothetical protein